MKYLARLSFLTALLIAVQTRSYFVRASKISSKRITFVFDKDTIKVDRLNYRWRSGNTCKTSFIYMNSHRKDVETDVEAIRAKLGEDRYKKLHIQIFDEVYDFNYRKFDLQTKYLYIQA